MSKIPCPNTTTCAHAHAQWKRGWYTRRGQTQGAGAKTSYVLRRLRQTLEHAGLDATLARAQMTAGELEEVKATSTNTMDDVLAERLDQAWSFLVYGVDTRRPDFPHGKANSYTRGHCRCHLCRDVAAREAKRVTLGRSAPGTLLRDPEILRRLAGHANKLLKLASYHQVARAAGVSRSSLDLARGARPLSMRMAQAILSTSPADVLAAALPGGVGDAARSLHQIRTMWALGYPLMWLAHELGIHPADLPRMGRNGKLTNDRIARVAGLAERIGDTPAGPSGGIPEADARRASNAALKAGWRPPAAYDDDMNLIPRAIPGHPWSRLDDRAAIVVTGAYLAGQGHSITEIARRLHASRPMLENDSRRVWGYTFEGSIIDHVASRPRFREVSDIFHAWEAGDIGPVTAALMIGQPFKNIGVGQKDHPELVAWRARQDGESTAA